MIKIDNALRQNLLTLALKAGAEIMKVYASGDMQTTWKEDRSPLTQADKASHTVLARELALLTPEIPVISEEALVSDYSLRRTWQYCWLLDPLDGTKEFLKRNNEFTVNIALIADGHPAAGVVYAPALDAAYSACSGSGAFKMSAGREIPIHAGDYRKEGLIIVASRSHAGDKVQALLARLPEAKLISSGSALKMCLVAEGRAHLYPRLSPTMEWDTAAAHCVVEEAGGVLRTVEGKPLLYNRENLLNPDFVVCGNPPFPWEEHRDLMVSNKEK